MNPETSGLADQTNNQRADEQLVKPDKLVGGLSKPAAYDEPTTCVQVIETHISWVFLTDSYAYKIKKPTRNAFLDYSTLQRRRFFCEEEVRLDRRYAPGLYIGVVPITVDGNVVHVDGTGRVVEYAVKMQRFEKAAMLEDRLRLNLVTADEIKAFAGRLADFHLHADRATPKLQFSEPADVLRQATDNLIAVSRCALLSEEDKLCLPEILEWTNWYFPLNQEIFEERLDQGYVRECHGDLHVGNVVMWQGELRPFDGVEFNPEFRWIDVLSDVGFLAMDLLVKQRNDLSSLLINSYLETTGDYKSLSLLRWYMVYRAMVRAKVAAMRLEQVKDHAEDFDRARTEFIEHLLLASHLIRQSKPRLWITHGVSGSGKSTGAERCVELFGAVRLRSDVERKRMLGMRPDYRPSTFEKAHAYSPVITDSIYGRLLELARGILTAGYPVVVDASFLKRRQRQSFQELARALGIDYAILSFASDLATLQQRLDNRARLGGDPSDADFRVLQQQLEHQEPLTDIEVQQFLSEPITAGVPTRAR